MQAKHSQAYKVTTSDLQSTWAPKHSKVQYGIGVITRPRIIGTRLAVFETIESAQYYASKNPGQRIFLCDVTSAKPVQFLYSQYSRQQMINFFKTGEMPEDSLPDWLDNEAQVNAEKYYSHMLAVTGVKLLEEIAVNQTQQ